MERPQDASLAWNRIDSLALSGLLALGVLIHIPHFIRPYVINIDAIDYVAGAQAIALGKLGEGMRLSHPSLYPILIALLYPLVGDWINSARLLSLTFGILTAVPFYMLSREILGSRKAWLPVLFYTVCPTVVSYSLDVVREPIFWFTTALFLWVLLRASRGSRWGYRVLAGTIALLCIGVRAEGILFIPLGFGFLIYAGIRSHRRLKCLGNAWLFLIPALFLALAVLFAMPGSWRRGVAFDLPSYRKQLAFAFLGTSDLGAEVQELVQEGTKRRARRFLSLAWDHRLVLVAWGLLEHWVRAAHPLLFALMLLGLPRKDTWRGPPWHLMACLMAVWILLGYVRFSGALAISKRHLIPLVMAGYLYGALGFSDTVDWMRRRWPKLPRKYVSQGLLVVILLTILPQSLKPIRQDKIARREAGEWIRTLGLARPAIVTDRPRVAFYGDGRAVPIKAFLEDPSMRADILVLEYKQGQRAPTDILERLRISGWKVTLLREFHQERESLGVYGLRRLPAADSGMHEGLPRMIRPRAAPSPTRK